MHKNFYLLLLLLFTSVSFSQTFSLTGKVTDPDETPLEAATVYLTSVKDSTVIDYTISDRNGNWELKTRKNENPVFLRVSYVGYANYKQQLDSVSGDKNFGTIKMTDSPTELGEVVIESEVPPIRIKSDTLEFNASSFKVRPDSNVEALLKQLPGVDIDPEGKITVNGKEVNEILVDGKSFFGKDGKIALQNLPADIIDKVQVSDTKTEKEKMTGRAASGNNSSINLTLQEGKNKGMFGKFVGGYGTDERYESSALLNYFKDDFKISVLASSNNINSAGFTQNEIFDSMGGGRSVYVSSDGSFGINGIRFGAGRGITQSHIVGLNYSDKWWESVNPSGSYFYTSADTENMNRSRTETFLTTDGADGAEATDERQIRVSETRSNSLNFAHNLNTEFRVELDSTTRLTVRPKFVRTNSKTTGDSQGYAVNQDNELLNESDGLSLNESDKSTFENSITFNKVLTKKGRSVTFEFDNNNEVTNAYNLNQSSTFFYNDEDGDGITDVTSDIRNQISYNRQSEDRYDLRVEFTEPVTDSLEVSAGTNYRWEQNVENREGFDYDEATGGFTDENELLTNYLRGSNGGVNPYAGLQLNKKRVNMGVNAGLNFTKFRNYGMYLGEEYELDKDYVFPTGDAYIRYSFAKSGAIALHYNYEVNFPKAREVLPIEDVSSALYTYRGYTDLDPTKSHTVYMNFNKYDFATRSGFFLYAGGSYYDNQTVNYSFIDDSGKTTTTYRNLGDTYYSWLGGNWSKTVKKEANSYRFSVGLNVNYGFDKGYINEELYSSKSIRLNPKVNFNWDYGEILTINPSYSYEYNQQDYTNYSRDQASNFVHKLNLQTTSYWPKNVVFGNDFAYTYNSIAQGFQKDFFLWNTSLGYNFLNDKLLFKVKVYDVLDQNIGTSRSIGATYIQDEQNIVLKRYVMFSLTFKIKKFAGKESSERSRFWFF